MKRAVRDVMTPTVVVVEDTAPFKEIVRRMQEFRVSDLPVVDEHGSIVGIVSEGDLILKEDTLIDGDGWFFGGRRRRIDREKAAGLLARELMTTPVLTIRPDAPLGEAARLMHRHQVKRLPVVGPEGEILGIVSRADLLKVFLREDLAIRREVTEDIVRRTLWIDPSTIHVVVRDGVVTLDGQMERRSLIRVLIGLVESVEGVVGVHENLSFLIDDTSPTAELPLPWTAITPGPGR